MPILSVARVIAFIVAVVGTSFLIPISVAWYLEEFFVLPAFIVPMVVSWIASTVVFFIRRKEKITLSTRAAIVVVALAWISAALMGAMPLYFSGAIDNFPDAFFEGTSGITTTGATVLDNIENLPMSINFWRCQMNWLGGMGIVALTVAILPMLGVGGFQLIKSETTGPEKGKITPTITSTAKTLWLIYVSFTLLQTGLLYLCDLNFIEALALGMSTLATGGFYIYNDSVGAFNSPLIEMIVLCFMFLSSINYYLYFYAFKRKSLDIRNNSELKAFVGIVVVVALLITILILPHYDYSILTALRHAFFNVVSLISTSGFSTVDYEQWVPSAQFLLYLLFFIGGCAGSTSGGIKVIRWVVLSKQMNNETKRMLSPHGVFSIRLNNLPARKDIVLNVTSFIALYILLVLITTFVGTLGDLDLLSALTAGLSMVGNVGPAFADVGPTDNFGFLPSFVKWTYSFAMLAGRLELYTMIIFFMPSFWRK